MSENQEKGARDYPCTVPSHVNCMTDGRNHTEYPTPLPVKDIGKTTQIAENVGKNTPNLPVKPSLEEQVRVLVKDARQEYTLALQDDTVNFSAAEQHHDYMLVKWVTNLLAEAEQRGYQKGREDALLMDAHQEAVDLAVREARKKEQQRYADLDPEDLTGRIDHFTKCKLCLEPSHHCTCEQVVYAINHLAKARLAELSDKESS